MTCQVHFPQGKKPFEEPFSQALMAALKRVTALNLVTCRDHVLRGKMPLEEPFSQALMAALKQVTALNLLMTCREHVSVAVL